jgi:hypothetical protein
LDTPVPHDPELTGRRTELPMTDADDSQLHLLEKDEVIEAITEAGLREPTGGGTFLDGIQAALQAVHDLASLSALEEPPAPPPAEPDTTE